jgi:hypothetical protein
MKSFLNKRKLKIDEGAPIFLKVGDFVFLAGENVIEKYECVEKTASGFSFQNIYTGKKFVYITPTPYFKSGSPLFKNGLPCYPIGHKGMEANWIKKIVLERGQDSVKTLLDTYSKMAYKSEVELFFINILVQACIDTIRYIDLRKINAKEEYWYADALGRVFAAWREAESDFGGIVNAMDQSGLFLQNIFELNVARAKRGGMSNIKIHTVKRAAKIGIEKALSRESKG